MSRSIANTVVRLSLALSVFGGVASTPLLAQTLRSLGVLKIPEVNVSVAWAAQEEANRFFPDVSLKILDYGVHKTGRDAVGEIRSLLDSDALGTPKNLAAVEHALEKASRAFDERRPSAHPVTDYKGRKLACVVIPASPGFGPENWAAEQSSRSAARQFFDDTDDLAHAWRMVDHEIAHCLVFLLGMKPPKNLFWPSWDENVAEYYAFRMHAARFGNTGYSARQAALRDFWAEADHSRAESLSRAVWSLGPAIRKASADSLGVRPMTDPKAALRTAVDVASSIALSKEQASSLQTRIISW